MPRCLLRVRALRRIVLTLVPLASVVAVPLTSLPAHAQVAAAGTCLVSATLQFVPAVGPVLGPVGYTLNGSSGLCEGALAPSASFSVSGFALASCEEVVTLFGAGSMSGGGLYEGVSLAASAGGSHVQQWVFPGTYPPALEASASLAWLNLGEMHNCALGGGTTTMTLLGTFTYAGQTLA